MRSHSRWLSVAAVAFALSLCGLSLSGFAGCGVGDPIFGAGTICDPGFVPAIGDPDNCCPADFPFSSPGDPFCYATP